MKRALIFAFLVNGFMGLAATHQVSIVDSQFVPEQLAVSIGDRVIWTNNDNTEHSVTSSDDDGASFDSGVIPPEDIYFLDFNASGSVAYYCTQHGRSMSGVIVVIAGTANDPPVAPANVLPAHNADNQPVAVRLSGSAFSDPDRADFHGASQWILRLASSGAVVVDSGIITGGTLTNFSPVGLTEGTGYDWQVRYRDGRGLWSEYSTATRFTTLVSVGARGIGLRASYNNLVDFLAPLVVVTNATIDFVWGNLRPHRRITADNFAVRWEGSLLPEFTQVYQIQLQYHGRARVWLKNELLIDEWTGCGFKQSRRGAVSLVAGQLAPVRVDYVADATGAEAVLRWAASTNLPLEVVPMARLFPPDQ